MREYIEDNEISVPAGRRRARAVAAQVLYQADVTGDAERITEQLFLWLEEFHVKGENKSFAEELTRGVLAVRAELDALLNERAKKWTVGRMSAVDRNLLRLALFEMLYCDSTPRLVVVNEAVELAKTFGGDESGSFINGILHGFLRDEDRTPAAAQP